MAGTKPRSVVFFGSSQLSADILQSLIQKPSPRYTITAVVTQPRPPHGHKHQLDNPVVAIAEANNLALFRPNRAIDIASQLQDLRPSAGLLFAYGQILPQAILSVFENGILNIHPSLLPKHRGPSPIEATILSGDTRAGVSLIKITEKMDAGPIMAQAGCAISNSINKAELTKQLLSMADKMTHQTLPDYADGIYEAKLKEGAIKAQNEATASYCKLIRKTDGLIWLHDETSTSLARKVRAYADWPKTRLPIRRGNTPMELIILETKPVSEAEQFQPGLSYRHRKLFARCQDQAIELLCVQLPGKLPMSAHELINGPEISITCEKGSDFISLNRE